jgi:hypothetical protein
MDTNALQPNLNSYAQSAQRQREQLAFVEHICGVLIESRSDVEQPPRPWRMFDGDVEGMFSKESVLELMPDWAFEFMPSEFVFSRFVSNGSARSGTRIAGIVWDAKGEPPASAGGCLPKTAHTMRSPNNASMSEKLWDARSNSPPVGSTDGLGRGSPKMFGTQLCCRSPHGVRAFLFCIDL